MDKGRYISMKVVIGLWIGVLLVISWDSFAQNTSMKLSETEFNNPSIKYRPHVWWHWAGYNISKDGITKDLEAMRQSGIGGATILQVNSGFQFGNYTEGVSYYNEKWWSFVEFAVAEAKRLGLELGIHNCPGYSASGGPWITVDKSMQELVWITTQVIGGSLFNDILPQPKTNLNYYKDIAVLAVPEFLSSIQQVVDLTEMMEPDGQLVWNAPIGKYTIYRIGHTSTSKSNHPIPAGLRSLEADKLSPETMKFHAENMLTPLIEKLGNEVGHTFKYILFDSYEAGIQNWTDNMPYEFKKRRGYDVIKWLPAITGCILVSKEQTEKFMIDFNSVIAEMYKEYAFEVPAKIFRASGLQVQIEPYEFPFDPSDITAVADEPMTEFWTNTERPHSAVAKSANPLGIRICAAEAFTGWPSLSMWTETPATLKESGDRAFALGGVNKLILHGWVHQPFPDTIKPGLCMGWWGTHFGRNQTWFLPGRAWIQYLSRSQYLLQSGLTVADYVVLASYTKSLKGLTENGDIISENTLMNNVRSESGKIVLDSGRKYSMLVLPESDAMNLRTLKKIRELVKGGAIVYGRKPVKSEGLMESDQEVLEISDEVWGNIDGNSITINNCGSGKVLYGMGIDKALELINIPGDITFTNADTKNILCTHRQNCDWDIYYFTNVSNKNVVTNVDLRVKSKVPEIWAPETGIVRELAEWYPSVKGTSIKLRLEPWEAVFVVFKNEVGQAEYVHDVISDSPDSLFSVFTSHPKQWAVRSSAEGTYYLKTTKNRNLKAELKNIPEPMVLKGDWEVRFDPINSLSPFQEKFIKLESWSRHPDERVKYFSGTATYRKTVKIPKENLREGIEVILDLGKVRDLAEVFVNGQSTTVLWHMPYICDITKNVKKGNNVIEIAVTNTWANRLIGDEQYPDDCEWGNSVLFHRVNEYGVKPPVGKPLKRLPDWIIKNRQRPSGQRTTFSSWNYFTKESPLQESGLLSEVKLIYEGVINFK